MDAVRAYRFNREPLLPSAQPCMPGQPVASPRSMSAAPTSRRDRERVVFEEALAASPRAREDAREIRVGAVVGNLHVATVNGQDRRLCEYWVCPGPGERLGLLDRRDGSLRTTTATRETSWI